MRATKEDLQYTVAGDTPGLLQTGACVLQEVNKPTLPDDDPSEYFIARGFLLEDVTEPGDPDQRWLCYFPDPRLGRDNRAAMFLCLDLAVSVSRMIAARWVVQQNRAISPEEQELVREAGLGQKMDKAKVLALVELVQRLS